MADDKSSMSSPPITPNKPPADSMSLSTDAGADTTDQALSESAAEKAPPAEIPGEPLGSPSGEPDQGVALATATFPAAGSIQPPPRLQRSSIPPPIDTENATRDADSSLREKLLSTLSPALPGAEQMLSKTTAQPEQTAACAETTALGGDAAGEPIGLDCSAACTHIGVAFSKNRRYRRTMEDAHCHQYDFEGVEGQAFMAIFDGHAGRQAAQWCGENFADVFLQIKQEHSGLPVPEIFNLAFIEADRRLAVDLKTHSGCTAAVAYLQVKDAVAGEAATRQRTLYCANVGDARAVLSRAGTAVRLTYDHKGDDVHECTRISESGGYVFNGRVNGILAVTRALGDSSLKQFVIGNPYTTETKLGDADDVLILACDGLWDVCSDQEAVDLVRSMDSHPAHTSQMLLEYALSNESTDNITTMVFRLPTLP
ncbi:mgpp2cl-1, protein phosphatase 2C-like protein 1 [Coemansia sp. IMI 209128]|nr:mgpp2cl-1, protein phosphatase 2C-like protein 1 [Coemansia sp. IMI 209128]